jgi:hypothetical protein
VLAAGAVVNLVLTFRLHFPVAPSALTPLEGAVAGAALAALLRARRLRIPAPAVAALAVGAAALLAIPASGFVRRHGETKWALVFPVVSWMESQPAFRDGHSPVATTPAYIGPLAGDRLTHRLEAIPRSEGCREVAARARSQWLVIYGGPPGVAPATLKPCLPPPAFDDGRLTGYRPPRG